MAGRPRTGQELLNEGVKDVSGAYRIKRLPLTARELQDVVVPRVASALAVPNEVNDDAVQEFCFQLGDLQCEVKGSDRNILGFVIDAGARDWLSHYVSTRAWRVCFAFQIMVSFTIMSLITKVRVCLGQIERRHHVSQADYAQVPKHVAADPITFPLSLVSSHVDVSCPSSEQDTVTDPASGTHPQPTVNELFARARVSKHGKACQKSANTAKASPAPADEKTIDSRVQCDEALEQLVGCVMPCEADWVPSELELKFLDRVAALHKSV